MWDRSSEQKKGFTKLGITSHCSELSLKAWRNPPGEHHAWLVPGHHDLENHLKQVSRCRSLKVQGQSFAKVHSFMAHKVLLPHPGGSVAPRCKAWAVLAPGGALVPEQSIVFFKTCYRTSSQMHLWVRQMALSGLRFAVKQQLEGLQYLMPN